MPSAVGVTRPSHTAFCRTRPAGLVGIQEGERIVGDQDLIKLAREAVETFNKADWDGTMTLLGASLYNEVCTGRQLRGKAEILPSLQGWRTAMPDVQRTATHAFASGHKALLERTWVGTQLGPLDC